LEARLSIEKILFGILLIVMVAAPYSPVVLGKAVPVQNSVTLDYCLELQPCSTTVHYSPSTMDLPLPATQDNPLPPIPAPQYVTSAPSVVRILVIAAAFSDVNATKPISEIKKEYFGTVANYYKEISYGAISIVGDVVGWVNLTYTQAHYGRDCTAIDDADCSGEPTSWQIAQDSIGYANKVVDLTNYDYLVVIHSGVGQETSKNKNTVWSVAYLGGIWIRATVGNSGKGRSFNKFDIAPEYEDQNAVPIGVYTHELGHLLGLPDLYDLLTGKTIMGPWALMDKGLWNGNPSGSSPAAMEAWSRIKLGWINGSSLVVVNSKSIMNFTVDPIEANSGGVHAIKIPISSDLTEYYLVEVRQRIGFDSALPSVGVLITHADDTLSNRRLTVMDAHPTVSGLANATWSVGQVFIDQPNNLAIAVTGEVGNSYQVTVNRLGPLPDLAVGKISTQPSTISPNTTVTISIDILNQGTKGATNVPVQVSLDGTILSTNPVSLEPGATTNITVTWKAVAGSHTLRVVIDPQNTISELNKANNIATYTLNVGPTLIITVPLAITAASNGTAWVKINGVQYQPDNSSQIKTSVPSGNVTIELDPAVLTALGVRQAFSGWSDGSSQNPRQLNVSSDINLQALYKPQYLLTVLPNSGVVSTGGWYDPNSTVTIAATSPSNVTSLASRLVFTQWSGDASSNSTSLSITLTKPMTLKANWKMQYYINVVSSVSSISGGGWYDPGTTATLSAQSPVILLNNTRQIFAGWSGALNSQDPTATITVNAPSLVQAQWKTQYLVQVLSPFGNPQGSGWQDAGGYAQVSIQPQVDSGNRTRRVFSGWAGDYSGSETNVDLKVDSPKVLIANWVTQYEVKFMVQGLPNSTSTKLAINNGVYDLSVPTAYEGWFNQGAQINPITNQTVHDQFISYPFRGWRNSTGGPVTPPFTVQGPADYTAVYQNTFLLPPIPGFPVESILSGIMLGLLGLALLRRRRRVE
jgi:M6 family metalloprotease-like protein